MSVENPPNIVFNDLTAAVDALEVSVEFVEQAVREIQRLRWAIIAAHQATQCFMIRALRGSDGTRILTQRANERLCRSIGEYKAKLWNYANQGGDFPTPPPRALASFPELYNKVKDPGPGGMGQFTVSKAFSPDPDDDKNIAAFNKLRNDFIHFGPGVWILDPGLAVASLNSAFRLMAFLAFKSHNVLWYPSEVEDEAKVLFNRGLNALNHLASVYATATP